MMDIASLYSDTTTVEIVHPATGAPIGITVQLHSPDSDSVKECQRKWQNRALKAKGEGFTADDIENQATDTLCAAIASWKWADGNTWQGETPSDTYAFKKLVLGSEAGKFIARQIDAALGNEAAFFAKPAKT